MANRNTWTADRRLYLDKDGKVVESDDPNRVTLLVAAGNTIPIDDAERLGLLEEKARSGPSENKLKTAPETNKAEVVPGVPALDIEEDVNASQGLSEGEGTPEQLAQFDVLATPPKQEETEPDIVFEPAPVLEAAVQEEPPKRGKRGQ